MCEVKYVFYFREMGDMANERREGGRLGESRERERERRRRRKGYPTPLHRMICVGSLRAFFVYV